MKRHSMDVISLVCGLFFLGVAALWGFAGPSVIDGSGWRLPLLLIGVGVLGLSASLITRNDDRR